MSKIYSGVVGILVCLGFLLCLFGFYSAGIPRVRLEILAWMLVFGLFVYLTCLMADHIIEQKTLKNNSKRDVKSKPHISRSRKFLISVAIGLGLSFCWSLFCVLMGIDKQSGTFTRVGIFGFFMLGKLLSLKWLNRSY